MPRTFAPPPPTSEEIDRICRETVGESPTSMTTLRSGAWSSAVGVETDGGNLVLRFSMSGDDFRADQLASRFVSPVLPIPAVYGIGQRGDQWWCLSERMPGVHLDELDANEMDAVIASLAAMLRAMRDVTAQKSTGFGGWDANGNGIFPTFADQLLDVATDTMDGARGSGWSVRLQPHTHAQGVFSRGMGQLRDLCHYIPPVRQLIHQDTLNFNVTVDDGCISGIFDWGCAMWGDALYDLAWFRFWNPWYPQWTAMDLPGRLGDAVGSEGDHTTERIHCYLLHIGLMHIRYNAYIENWESMYQVVAATERLLEDVHK